MDIDNSKNMSIIGGVGTGGTSDASGNPPVSVFNEIISRRSDYLYDLGFEDAIYDISFHVLNHIGTFHLLPYTDIVYDSVIPSMKTVHDLITFDRRFQSVVFKYIGIIESKFRTQYSMAMEEYHGLFSAYDPSLFLRKENYDDSIKRISKEIESRTRRDYLVKEIYLKNDNKLPIEVLVECVTLGQLTMLYSNTKSNDVVNSVAHSFSCSANTFRSWIKTVSSVRNVCAHFDSYVTKKQIPIIPKRIKECGLDNRKIFYIVPIIYCLLGQDDYYDDINVNYRIRFLDDIEKVLSEFLDIHHSSGLNIDIPENWKEELLRLFYSEYN